MIIIIIFRYEKLQKVILHFLIEKKLLFSPSRVEDPCDIISNHSFIKPDKNNNNINQNKIYENKEYNIKQIKYNNF